MSRLGGPATPTIQLCTEAVWKRAKCSRAGTLNSRVRYTRATDQCWIKPERRGGGGEEEGEGVRENQRECWVWADLCWWVCLVWQRRKAEDS